jgi:hypothetical protein
MWIAKIQSGRQMSLVFDVVPRQNAIRAQKGLGLDIGNSLGKNCRLGKDMLSEHGRSRMSFRPGRQGLAGTLLPVVPFFYSKEKLNSGGQVVTMMQTAEPGHRYNLACSYRIRPCFAPGRCSLDEREMRAVVMIVADVLFHQPP